jgi:hypothetical protein
MSEPAAAGTPEWATVATKKELVTYMKENGSPQFLQENKLTGKFEQLVKKTSKDALVAKYRAMLAAQPSGEGADTTAADEAAAGGVTNSIRSPSYIRIKSVHGSCKGY